METDYLIAIEAFCASHQIEVSFISSLRQTGLIEITTVEETGFIDAGQIQDVEKFVRFHYDLDINIEGIETLSHILKRIEQMQSEMTELRNRLRLYEPE